MGGYQHPMNHCFARPRKSDFGISKKSIGFADFSFEARCAALRDNAALDIAPNRQSTLSCRPKYLHVQINAASHSNERRYHGSQATTLAQSSM
ncbi:hypothetical protein [Bradyrhizobium sp. RT3b]|uniref:hypothetical protein n=1 Tax=Bradyrhizobium sp. RT3b TaxID=3156334 RepID=UPI003391B2F8